MISCGCYYARCGSLSIKFIYCSVDNNNSYIQENRQKIYVASAYVLHDQFLLLIAHRYHGRGSVALHKIVSFR